MLLRVYADTPEEFERWVKQQRQPPASDPAVAAGRLVFERTACINCHAIGDRASSRLFGPDLTHLMSRETLGSGILPNTPENLAAWVRDPQLIKPGCLMPAFGLGDRERDDIVRYLLTLR